MRRHDNILGYMFIGVLLPTCLIAASTAAEAAVSWPQFRGTNCSGIGVPGTAPPIQFGPERNVLWKTTIPHGHSSKKKPVFLKWIGKKRIREIRRKDKSAP